MLRSYTRIVLLVALPCIAYVGAVGSDLVTLITGHQYYTYRAAASVAPIVACGSLLFALAGLANTGLVIARKTKFLALSNALGLIVNIAANIALIPWLGIKGAAIATPIGYGVYLVATYFWARPHATWQFPVATAVRALVAAVCGYVVVRVLPLAPNSIYTLLFAALAGAAVYVSVLVVLGERRAMAAS
jgi:O-antigen/teichoic acid export membrane protein